MDDCIFLFEVKDQGTDNRNWKQRIKCLNTGFLYLTQKRFRSLQMLRHSRLSQRPGESMRHLHNSEAEHLFSNQ